MNTDPKPFFIFYNSFGRLIKCYDNKNLRSLFDRLTEQEKIEVQNYIDCLQFGIVYGEEIKN